MNKNSKYSKLISETTKESVEIVRNALEGFVFRLQLDETKQYLKSKGVDIEGKDFDTVVKEISQKWNSFGNDDKVAIATHVAGRFQMTKFSILMSKLAEESELS